MSNVFQQGRERADKPTRKRRIDTKQGECLRDVLENDKASGKLADLLGLAARTVHVQCRGCSLIERYDLRNIETFAYAITNPAGRWGGCPKRTTPTSSGDGQQQGLRPETIG